MILGPGASPRKKVVGRYRWQVLFKAGTRGPVRNLVKKLLAEGHFTERGLKIVVDVDPTDLM
jgi:primosomal protein N'